MSAHTIAETAGRGRGLDQGDLDALRRDVQSRLDKGQDEMKVLDWACRQVDRRADLERRLAK
jgi:hypothetical protein